jgi:hypothetical protein
LRWLCRDLEGADIDHDDNFGNGNDNDNDNERIARLGPWP